MEEANPAPQRVWQLTQGQGYEVRSLQANDPTAFAYWQPAHIVELEQPRGLVDAFLG